MPAGEVRILQRPHHPLKVVENPLGLATHLRRNVTALRNEALIDRDILEHGHAPF
ncbi:hypothetical protein [Streptomyces albiflavescens]|uniref:hypothetical protein n=1 Tax=Streptomyces albiflavescens TaxID=1623582 RepID=UPI00166A34AD